MADEQPTAAEQAEAAEWDAAYKEFAPGLAVETTETTTVAPEDVTTTTTVAEDVTTTTTVVEDTTTTTTVANDTTTTTTIDPNETAEQKAAREAAETTTTTTVVEEDEPDFTGHDMRAAAREAAKFAEEVKADVREKMFADVPKTLTDSDGDPIKGLDDVMKLLDPRTGEPFTLEAAGVWLLNAQQEFNKRVERDEKQIEQIAEVHVDMKDQADAINYKYGEFLKARPDIRDALWAKYESSLIKDPTTGIIIGMPMPLETFYETALEPYAKLAEGMENTQAEEARKAAEAKAIADKKAEDDKKKNDRLDRSDIFGPAQTDMSSDEEKEWNTAAADYYGPQLKKS